MKVEVEEVLAGSFAAGSFYLDTGQSVRVNKTAWRVAVTDDYGDEEVFYFQLPESAYVFVREELGEEMEEC